MKKIIAFIFLFASVTVLAQNITDDDTTARPAISAIGTPTGKIVKMIMK